MERCGYKVTTKRNCFLQGSIVLLTYLCNVVSCFIFFIRAKAFVRGTPGRRNLLSNGNRNWQFFGTFRNLSPSMFIMERVNGTSDAAELGAIFWDMVTAGVISMNSSSSSLNTSSSSDSSSALCLDVASQLLWSCTGVCS
jgi:hypothetical protein